MESKRLIKKTGVYFIGNLSSKILSTILVPIYAFYISTNDLGYFDFSQTMMSVLSPILVFAIWEAILKYLLVEEDKDKQQKIVSSSTIFCCCSILFLIFLAFIYNYFFDDTIRYLWHVVLMISIQTLVTVWQYYARSFSHDKYYILAGVFSTIVNFILVVVFVIIYKMGLLGLLLAYNFGQITAFVILERKMKIFIKLKFSDFDMNILKKMLKYASPLVLNLISLWAISGFARMIITLKLGADSNGLYSFASKFSSIIAMLGSVLTMAIIEESILSIKEKEFSAKFNRTIKKTFSIFFALAFLAIPAINIFYYTIQGTDYYLSKNFTPWLLMFAIFTIMSTSVGSIFQALDRTRHLFYTTLLGGGLTVVMILSLINTTGLRGVVIAQTIGAFIMLFTRCILANKLVELKMQWLKIAALISLFVVISIVCFMNGILISIIIAVLIVVAILYMYRESVSNIYMKIKQSFG